MNRRTTIIIGVSLVVLGLVALVFFGYKIFYVPSTTPAIVQQFSLQQETKNVVDAAQHGVVVKGLLYPGISNVSSLACLTRVWDWGDGATIKDDSCVEADLIGKDFLTYTAEHRYKTVGTYKVKLYVFGADKQVYETEALSVVAK